MNSRSFLSVPCCSPLARGAAMLSFSSLAFAIGCGGEASSPDDTDPQGAGGSFPNPTASGGGSPATGGQGTTLNPEKPWLDLETPTASPVEQPLTCEVLEGQNCWKVAVDEAVACMPQTVGTLSADGLSCSFEDGSRVVFSFEVSAAGGLVFAEHTVFGPTGTPCYSIQSDGWGDYTLGSRNHTVAYDSLSHASYRVVCEDGTPFSSQNEAACDATALRGPQFVLVGQKTSNGEPVLNALVSGTSSNEQIVGWSCQ